MLVPVQAIVLDSCGLGALGEGERAIKSKCNIFNLACTFILNFLPFLSIVQSIGLNHEFFSVLTSFFSVSCTVEIDGDCNDGEMMGGKTAS